MFTRHTSPETRNAIRDHVATQMAREPRVILPAIKWEPHVKVAWTVSMALVACGWVETLPL